MICMSLSVSLAVCDYLKMSIAIFHVGRVWAKEEVIKFGVRSGSVDMLQPPVFSCIFHSLGVTLVGHKTTLRLHFMFTLATPSKLFVYSLQLIFRIYLTQWDLEMIRFWGITAFYIL